MIGNVSVLRGLASYTRKLPRMEISIQFSLPFMVRRAFDDFNEIHHITIICKARDFIQRLFVSEIPHHLSTDELLELSNKVQLGV